MCLAVIFLSISILTGHTTGETSLYSRDEVQLLVRLNEKIREVTGELEILENSVAKLKKSGVQTFPRNCLEALWQGFTTSGIYTIQPDAGAPFEVWCDQTTDNGGWTVFQRRQDGSENFRRNRNDYVNGFGRLDGEFWLGLEKIHRLSTWIDFEPRLRVDLEDFDKSKSYATVRFFIDGPPNYVLHVYDYLGNAGNALVYHNGRGFSTFDNDIDGWSSGNCAIRDEGGWWFNSCQHCHLNGGYYFGTRTSSWKGVIWYTWKGADHSLKGSEMKLRPSILSWPWERVNG